MQTEARFTPEKLVLGPFLEIWAAADIRIEDGKWRENVPEPRIMGGASTLLSEEDRARYGRLWAAAPDMYEALAPFAALAAEIDALRHEDNSTCLHRLKASDIRRAALALSKALGSPDPARSGGRE